jgi:hypothetical protein
MSNELQKNPIQAQVEMPAAIEKFTTIFAGIHKVDKDVAKQMYEVEKFQFMSLVNEKSLLDTTPLSAMGVFLDVVSNGLSFSSTAKHVYVMSRSVKAGKDQHGKDIYEKRLYYQTQPDGKIYQAQRAGSISHISNPVMVYEGDNFAPCTNESGHQIIIHKPIFPRTSNKLIAGYIYKVHPNGDREPFWMDMQDVARLKAYSEKQNAKWDDTLKKRVPGPANPLYTSNDGQIDPGFFGSKLINFALKNVRKSGKPSQHELEDDALPEIDPNAHYTPTLIAGAPEASNTTVNPEGQLQQPITSSEPF